MTVTIGSVKGGLGRAARKHQAAHASGCGKVHGTCVAGDQQRRMAENAKQTVKIADKRDCSRPFGYALSARAFSRGGKHRNLAMPGKKPARFREHVFVHCTIRVGRRGLHAYQGTALINTMLSENSAAKCRVRRPFLEIKGRFHGASRDRMSQQV